MEALLYFLDSILVTKHNRRGKNQYLKRLGPDTIQEEYVFIRGQVCRYNDGFVHLVTRNPQKYPCKIAFVRIDLR